MQVRMPTKTVSAARKAGKYKPPTHADGLDRVGRLRSRCAIEISGEGAPQCIAQQVLRFAKKRRQIESRCEDTSWWEVWWVNEALGYVSGVSIP